MAVKPKFQEKPRGTSSRDKGRKRPDDPRSPESRRRARQERAAERDASPDLSARVERARLHAGRGRKSKA